MKNYLLLLISVVFFSCNTSKPDTAPERFDASSGKGLIIGTLTFDGDKPQNDIYRFFYEATSGDKKFKKRNEGKIMIKARENNVRAFTGDFNDKRTYLFVIEREPGTYAFTSYNYLNHIGNNGMVNYSTRYAIPFEVKKGQIQYIGEMEFMSNAIKGTPRIIVSDNSARDLAEFRKKFPQINWDNTINNTVKSGDTGDGLVEFR